MFVGPSCTFEKVLDKKERKHADCKNVGGFSKGSLQNCKAIARGRKANAMNFKNGMCYSKQCPDLKNLKTKTSSGWDVYILKCQEADVTGSEFD